MGLPYTLMFLMIDANALPTSFASPSSIEVKRRVLYPVLARASWSFWNPIWLLRTMWFSPPLKRGCPGFKVS
ncbi:MAG: hypothetical protein QXF73_05100, partial [Desulfurococcaceae archaeon]